MTRLKTEQCIYVGFDEDDRSEYIILALYVDDLVIEDRSEYIILAPAPTAWRSYYAYQVVYTPVRSTVC